MTEGYREREEMANAVHGGMNQAFITPRWVKLTISFLDILEKWNLTRVDNHSLSQVWVPVSLSSSPSFQTQQTTQHSCQLLTFTPGWTLLTQVSERAERCGWARNYLLAKSRIWRRASHMGHVDHASNFKWEVSICCKKAQLLNLYFFSNSARYILARASDSIAFNFLVRMGY